MSDGEKKIPFMLELDNAKWLHDSDSMYPYLEDKYTSKKLGKIEELPEVYALSPNLSLMLSQADPGPSITQASG